MAIYLVVSFAICVLYYLSYLLYFKNRNYWKSRNVPYVKPLPLFGNYKDSLLLKTHRSDTLNAICQQFPNEPYIGSFYGTTPALVVQDPDLLKLIMTKEFLYFSGREASDHNHKEPFMKNIVMAHGDEWKILRTNLTRLFSAMKLKNMFSFIKKSSDAFEGLLAEEIKTNMNIDVGDLLSKYTMDIITACFFGLCSDTMNKSTQNNLFTKIGENFTDTSACNAIKNICRSMWPGLFYMLRFKLLDDSVGAFFNELISGVFKHREETKTSKNDFVDLILTWKKHDCITGESLSKAISGDKKPVSISVNEELLIAQCELMFGAGFETTATAMSYLLYELANNRVVQDKLIAEVDEYFSKREIIEYECTSMLPYIESCIEECLRLHPIFGFLSREVTHDYSLPTGLRLKKGDRIHIPVHHIQNNPVNFPKPELFRPERFLGEEKKNIKPYTYMPFGEGPRVCLGMRFAKMPIYAAVLKIFKNYKVELAENMPQIKSHNPKSLAVSQPTTGIYIKFIPRKA